MMQKPKRLPPRYFLLQVFDYDPVTGGIWKKGEEQNELNACGSVNTGGFRYIQVPHCGRCLAQRLAWLMFYDEDPVDYFIRHKNGDKLDNRIENLRKVKIKEKTQADTVRQGSRYEYGPEDDDD